MYPVGGRPTRGKSQSPVARIACAEQTERIEPIDKAIHGKVSKSSSFNESERTGDLENLKSKGRTEKCGYKSFGGAFFLLRETPG